MSRASSYIVLALQQHRYASTASADETTLNADQPAERPRTTSRASPVAGALAWAVLAFLTLTMGGSIILS